MASSIPSMDYLSLVCDDVYQILEKHFLAQGKGRRISLPVVTCTNKLFVQLYCLRETGKCSWDKVFEWIRKLYPETTYPHTASQAQHFVLKIVKEIPQSDSNDFLQQPVDLDFVTETLSLFGLNRKTLLDPSLFQPSDGVVTNAVVVELENFRSRNKLPYQLFETWLKCLNVPSSKLNVTEVLKIHKLFQKQKDRNPKDYISFLSTKYPNLPAHEKLNGTSSKQSDVELVGAKSIGKSKQKFSETEFLELKDKVHHFEEILREKNSIISALEDENHKLKSDNAVLRTQIQTMKLEMKTEKDSILQKLKDVKKVKKGEKVQNLKKKIRRRDTIIKDLKSKINILNVSAEQQRQVSRRKFRLTLLQKNKLRNEITKKNKLVNNLKNKLAVKLEKKFELQTRTEHGRFTDDIRKTVIALQGCGVVASNCSDVIKTASHHVFHTNIEKNVLPCVQSCLNMSHEGHFLSKFQTTEHILKSENFTLHTDGTTKIGQKLIGHQITLDDGNTLSLGFTSVATEDAATLLEVTMNILNELSETHDNKDDVVHEILKKLSSTMSDRASVMKKFNDNFDEYRQAALNTDEHLHFLYCNAHYLLGLSRAAEQTLQKIEKEIGSLGHDTDSKFSRFHKGAENATSRFVRTACDVLGPRGDEKNGVRAEWVAFCSQHDIKSRVTSYRNNRFNNYFEGAAALIHHKLDIVSFLKNGYLVRSNLKLESVAADAEDDRLMTLVLAVALIFHNVTGPYWELLQSSIKYGDVHVYIKKMATVLQQLEKDPSEILDKNFPGIFNGEFRQDSPTIDSVYDYLQSLKGESIVMLKSALQELFKNFLKVTERQLCDFLGNGKYTESNRSADTLIAHCPLTNLLGERCFGDLDFDFYKRRHSSLHHHTTINMLKRNRTGDWLSSKESQESADLMKKARGHCRQLRAVHKNQERLVMLKIKEKMLENKRKKLEKQQLETEKKATLLQAVRTRGGPCHCANDVKKLLNSVPTKSKLKDALQNELRLQKTIMGFKTIRISGSIPQLIKRLSKHLSPESADIEYNPCDQKRKLPVSLPESENSDIQLENDTFKFGRQGIWVAVYYDDRYYTGQVLEVNQPDLALVQFLCQMKTKTDLFKWPASDDIAEVKSCFVFDWNFNVQPVSSDGRTWKVENIGHIDQQYSRIKMST